MQGKAGMAAVRHVIEIGAIRIIALNLLWAPGNLVADVVR
jgi:hypothetical protein